MRLSPLPLLVLIAIAPALAVEDSGGDPTATAMQLAHRLEEQPLGKDARRARQWLMEWLVYTPEVTVPYCRVLLAPLTAEFKYGQELMDQVLFSSAIFMLEHPDEADDDHAVYVAGIAGALVAYEAIVAKKPKTRVAQLDNLLARRDEGRLERFVEEGMVSCRLRGND